MFGNYFIVKEEKVDTNCTSVKHNRRTPISRKKGEIYVYYA